MEHDEHLNDSTNAAKPQAGQYPTPLESSVTPAAQFQERDTFLHALLGDHLPIGLFAHAWRPSPTQTTWVRSAVDVERSGHRGWNDVYIGVGLRGRPGKHTERLKVADANGLLGFVADVDVADKTHKSKKPLPLNQREALDFLDSLEVKPTLIINSGHGIQAWWLFTEPWRFADEADHTRAQRGAAGWQAYINAKAAQHGWEMDSVGDLARLMRVPGTFNAKDREQIVPVRLLHLDDTARYDPATLTALCTVVHVDDHKRADSGNITRFTEFDPCPVCGGYPSLPFGRGQRCWGFIGGRGGNTVYCTREELAGDLEPQTTSIGVVYAHPLLGPCPCGVKHAHGTRGLLGPDGFPLESDGDADRFAARWAGEILYCAEERCWYRYNGVVWERDRTEHVTELAKIVVREFRVLVGAKADEANVYGVGGVADYARCSQHAVRMGSGRHIAAMLELARSKKELAVTPEQFDADPLMFNTLNCTLDLDTTTGKVSSHPHNPHDLLRRVASANYQPDTTHTLVEQAFRRFHPEPDHRAFIEELAGYCMTGLPKRHGLQLLGPHDSGKSTMLAMFQNTWGDYAKSLKDTNLAKNPHRSGDVARPDLLRVVDARLVTITEVDPDTKFDVALFKAILSGTDTVGLRTLYDKGGGKDELFHCSIWMSGNKEYGLPSDEGAGYDRVEVLDCNHVVPERERNGAEEVATTDPAVVGDAVLALAVRGFQRLYGGHGGDLQPPASAITAKQELREKRDQWSAIIEQALLITNDPNDAVKKSEAWDVARYMVSISGETIHKPRALQRSFEEALAWRVGSKPTHSAARWAGKFEYWPGVKWSTDSLELASGGFDISLPDWSAE